MEELSDEPDWKGILLFIALVVIVMSSILKQGVEQQNKHTQCYSKVQPVYESCIMGDGVNCKEKSAVLMDRCLSTDGE